MHRCGKCHKLWAHDACIRKEIMDVDNLCPKCGNRRLVEGWWYIEDPFVTWATKLAQEK